MFTGSIKISELDILSRIVDADFFPLVQSGSLTTYRVNITTLNDWNRISGSALSASWASASIASGQSVSASWASSSINSIVSVSASFASASISASYALSASRSEQTLSSSFADVAVSASYAPFSQAFQVSASWASQSLSSSFAISASYSPVLGDTTPIGAIMGFGTTVSPNNWLECNGAAYSTASFADLYAAISSSNLSSSFGYLCDSFGNRDATGGYFKMPDFRGEFLRGWDHNKGIDINRIFGSIQTASVGSHYHGVGNFDGASNNDSYLIYRSWNDGNSYTGRSLPGDGSPGASFATVPNGFSAYPIGTSNPVGVTSDVYPRNVSIMWCIKYTNSTNFAGTTSASVAGDVVGNLSSTTVVKIQNIPITSSAPVNGDILLYDSSSNVWYGGSPNIGAASGKSYWVANPGAIFGNGDDLYIYNYSNTNSRRNLVHINQNTNVITYKIQWPQDAWNLYGRIFRKSTDNALHIITFSDVDLYDYDIDGNTVTRLTGSGGHYYDLPVKVSWASGSLRPTVWALYGSYNASTNGNTPLLKWRKHWWNGSSWQHDFGPTLALDLHSVQNATEYNKFVNYTTNPSDVQNTLLLDYNPIKKRYYLLDGTSGYLHIFTQDVGDIDTNFNTSSISYLKTLAVPVSSMDNWQDADAEKIVIDYHPDLVKNVVSVTIVVET